jgi:tetratricopeptide (TPR) repeat protein
MHARARGPRLLALAVCAALAAPSAFAAPARAAEDAETTVKEALAAYDAGRYAEASELFERAYRETHLPALLFNIAQASRLLGDCPRAIAYYKRFVADAPTSADRPRAEIWLAELGTCAPPATPPPPIATTPSPPVAPPPPPAPGPSSPPLLVAAAAAPSPTPPADRRRVPAILALAGSFALSSAGAALAWQAHDDSLLVARLFSNGGVWDDAAVAIDRQGHRDQTLSIVCFSVAAALAAAGVTLLAWPSPSSAR